MDQILACSRPRDRCCSVCRTSPIGIPGSGRRSGCSTTTSGASSTQPTCASSHVGASADSSSARASPSGASSRWAFRSTRWSRGRVGEAGSPRRPLRALALADALRISIPHRGRTDEAIVGLTGRKGPRERGGVGEVDTGQGEPPEKAEEGPERAGDGAGRSWRSTAIAAAAVLVGADRRDLASLRRGRRRERTECGADTGLGQRRGIVDHGRGTWRLVVEPRVLRPFVDDRAVRSLGERGLGFHPCDEPADHPAAGAQAEQLAEPDLTATTAAVEGHHDHRPPWQSARAEVLHQ